LKQPKDLFLFYAKKVSSSFLDIKTPEISRISHIFIDNNEQNQH